jgi:hypothetical protein
MGTRATHLGQTRDEMNKGWKNYKVKLTCLRIDFGIKTNLVFSLSFCSCLCEGASLDENKVFFKFFLASNQQGVNFYVFNH